MLDAGCGGRCVAAHVGAGLGAAVCRWAGRDAGAECGGWSVIWVMPAHRGVGGVASCNSRSSAPLRTALLYLTPQNATSPHRLSLHLLLCIREVMNDFQAGPGYQRRNRNRNEPRLGERNAAHYASFFLDTRNLPFPFPDLIFSNEMPLRDLKSLTIFGTSLTRSSSYSIVRSAFFL